MGEHRAILELHARYANTIDDGDAAGWARCFTPDGVLRTTRPLEVRGREQLERFARDWAASGDGPSRHVSWHHLVERDGNELVGRCSAALLRTSAAGVRIAFTAVYHDRFAEVDGEWLIRARVVTIDAAR